MWLLMTGIHCLIGHRGVQHILPVYIAMCVPERYLCLVLSKGVGNIAVVEHIAEYLFFFKNALKMHITLLF